MTLWLRLTSAVMVATAALMLMACGDDDADDSANCVAGAACVCDSDCSETCGGDGSGCAFDCNGGSCNFSCPGGGCEASSNGATAVTLDCPGDGCTLTCTNTDSCRITGCGANCILNCGGATTCESSCDITEACPTTP